MGIREDKYDYYCLMIQAQGFKPVPYSLFTETIMNMKHEKQIEYTKWFWEERGEYHT